LNYCPVEALEYREQKGEFFNDIGTAVDIYAIANVERVLLLDVS
jgi:DNA/RNA-binding domain of Phe-tRNA-synthetase-like protein